MPVISLPLLLLDTSALLFLLLLLLDRLPYRLPAQIIMAAAVLVVVLLSLSLEMTEWKIRRLKEGKDNGLGFTCQGVCLLAFLVLSICQIDVYLFYFSYLCRFNPRNSVPC